MMFQENRFIASSPEVQLDNFQDLNKWPLSVMMYRVDWLPDYKNCMGGMSMFAHAAVCPLYFSAEILQCSVDYYSFDQ